MAAAGGAGLHSAQAGAYASGIDASCDAMELAKGSFANWIKKDSKIAAKADFILSDFESFKFPQNSFDAVFLSDVVEHISKEQLGVVLVKINELLKPGGRIILHTSPNKIFLFYGLKLYCLLGNIYGKRLNWNMKKILPEGLGGKYHVNEQSVFSLRRYFKRAGFSNIELWLEKNPQWVYYFFEDDIFIPRINLLYKLLPIKHLFFADIYGIVRK